MILLNDFYFMVAEILLYITLMLSAVSFVWTSFVFFDMFVNDKDVPEYPVFIVWTQHDCFSVEHWFMFTFGGLIANLLFSVIFSFGWLVFASVTLVISAAVKIRDMKRNAYEVY